MKNKDQSFQDLPPKNSDHPAINHDYPAIIFASRVPLIPPNYPVMKKRKKRCSQPIEVALFLEKVLDFYLLLRRRLTRVDVLKISSKGDTSF